MNRARNRVRNVPASVRQRLLNLARELGVDFNLTLDRYICERFLYRLSRSTAADRFVLKGAALFRLWTKQEFRPTRDVDLLGHGFDDLSTIRQTVAEICAIGCPEDGIEFDPGSIRVASIRDDQENGGVRVTLQAKLGTARLPLQVDIGFGDVVSPAPVDQDYPTLLDHPAPRLKTYPREAFIAEKFDAMVRLGPMNTRIKDFWDVAV